MKEEKLIDLFLVEEILEEVFQEVEDVKIFIENFYVLNKDEIYDGEVEDDVEVIEDEFNLI